MTPASSPGVPASGHRCVFTTLIGRYEQLNEQPSARQSEVPYLCLTDDPELRSETWQVRLISPALELDPIRSQRDLKIRSHLHLAEFERSLYIDNGVRLTVPAEEVFALVPAEAPLAMVPHSFRERVLDEFLAVAELGLDDQGRIFEQLNHYQLSAPEMLDERPWWTGFLVRDHTDPAVRRMGELWYGHVLRYSRRDQLSVNLALRQAGLAPHVLDLVNHASAVHSWSHPPARDRSGIRRPLVSLMPPPARIRAAELALAEQRSRAAALEEALTRETSRADELEGTLASVEETLASAEETLAANVTRASELERALADERALSSSILRSTSWRLTAPARNAGFLVRDRVTTLRRRRAGFGEALARLRRTDLREEAFYGYFELVYRVRCWTRGRRSLPVGPDPVTRPYLLWKVAQLLGIELVPLTDAPVPLAFHFHDTTLSTIDLPAAARVLNGACRDISKRRVERAMVAAFGYGLAVDPTTHVGPMVEKSDRNAAHDGVVIEGPIAAPDPDKVYQRVVDNEVEPDIVEDLRAAVVAGSVVVVFRKRRPIEKRFGMDPYTRPWRVSTESVFSDRERSRIVALAADMGLDMGEMDITCDRGDGHIYVLDATTRQRHHQRWPAR